MTGALGQGSLGQGPRAEGSESPQSLELKSVEQGAGEMETGESRWCGDTVRGALDVIGGKWSMLVLWELLGQDRRYAELQRRVIGISQKVLSTELKSLVGAGLVEREVAPTVPPQVTYRITAEGRGLEAVFAALHTWGLRRAT